MGRKMGSRRRQILELLLQQRSGLSLDEAAERMGISRTAAQQHIAGLEQRGFVAKAARHKTGGRPVQIYVLTDAGLNYFPKQYAWFSELLLQQLKDELGKEAVLALMSKLGAGLARQLAAGLEGKELSGRLDALLAAMHGLGYQASSDCDPKTGVVTIKALHCVYHDIAQKHPEVCQFDRALLAGALGCGVEQVECMAEGAGQCCFKLIDNG